MFVIFTPESERIIAGIGSNTNSLNTGFPKILVFLLLEVFATSSSIPIIAAKRVATIIAKFIETGFVYRRDVIEKERANIKPPPLTDGCFNIIPGC